MQTQINRTMPIAKSGMVGDAAWQEKRSYGNRAIQVVDQTVTAANLETVSTINGTAYVADSITISVTAADLETEGVVNGNTYTANVGAAVMTQADIAIELADLINAGEGDAALATAVGNAVVVESVSDAITATGGANATEAQTARTTTEIAAQLATAINASDEPVSAVAAAAVVTVTADDYETGFTIAATTNMTQARVIDAPARINFGLVVCIDPNDNSNCKLPAIAADLTSTRAVGATVAANERVGYATGEVVTILKKGNIWVEAEEVMAPGDGVFARFTASGANTTLGRVRTDNDGATAGQVAGAEVLDYDANTELAFIAFNRP
jgi:hypothetical protein